LFWFGQLTGGHVLGTIALGLIFFSSSIPFPSRRRLGSVKRQARLVPRVLSGVPLLPLFHFLWITLQAGLDCKSKLFLVVKSEVPFNTGQPAMSPPPGASRRVFAPLTGRFFVPPFFLRPTASVMAKSLSHGWSDLLSTHVLYFFSLPHDLGLVFSAKTLGAPPLQRSASRRFS